MKNLTGPRNYQKTTGVQTGDQMTPTTGDAKKKSTFKDDIKKSAKDFFLTAPYMVAYFAVVPVVLKWIIGNKISLPWCWVIAAGFFIVVTGIIHYTWGEHWPVGKKILGFTLTAMIVLVVSLMQIYFNKPVSPDTISISDSGIFNFELEPMQSVDKWIETKEDLYCKLTASEETPYPFYVKLKDSGALIKLDKPGTKVPDRPGPFKLIAAEKKVKISLLVTKRANP